MAEQTVNAECTLRKRIRNAAVAALRRYPEESACKKHPVEEIGLFLTEVHKLLDESTHAIGWNDIQLESMTKQIASMRLAFDAGIKHAFTLVDRRVESCTFDCKAERDECIRNDCGTDTSYPCGCCAPCNLTWVACMADCII